VKKAAAKGSPVAKKLTFGEEAEEVIGAADGTPEQKVSGHLDESTPFSVGHQEQTWNTHFEESTPFSDGREKKAWISRFPPICIIPMTSNQRLLPCPQKQKKTKEAKKKDTSEEEDDDEGPLESGVNSGSDSDSSSSSDEASKKAKKEITRGIEKHRKVAIRRTEVKNKRQKRATEEVEGGTPEDKGRGTASATGTAAGSPTAKKKDGKKKGDTTAKDGKNKGTKNKAGKKNDACNPDDISEDGSAEKEVSRYLATWRRFRDNVHFDESTPFSDGRQKKAWISWNPIVWIT
jgi:hypothetical protein